MHTKLFLEMWSFAKNGVFRRARFRVYYLFTITLIYKLIQPIRFSDVGTLKQRFSF